MNTNVGNADRILRIIAGIILISLVPIGVEWWKARREKKALST